MRPCPSIVLSQLDIINQLSNNVYCRDNPAAPVSTILTRQLGAPTSIYFVATLLANLYSETSTSVSWDVQTSIDQVLLQQVVNAELDLAFINPNNVDADMLQAALTSPDSEMLLLPLFTTAVVYTYNPTITPTVNSKGHTLTLDMQTMGLINYACITQWNHPAILRQNPWLAAQLPPLSVTSINITQIQGCGISVQKAPLSWGFIAAVSEYLAMTGDAVLQQCVDNYPDALWNAYYTCTSVPQYGLMYVSDEASVAPLVLGTTGAMGVQQASGDPSYGVIRITDTRDGVPYNTSGDAESEGACVSDTANTVPLGLSAASHQPACYRATQQLLAVLRKTYVSRTTDASSCDRGYDALSFLAWIATTPAVGALARSREMNLVPTLLSATEYALAVQNLDSIVCDDQVLLVNVPRGWSLTGGIAAFVIVVSVVGLIYCTLTAVFVGVFVRDPAIRSASPLFLILSIGGVVVLFVAGFLLVARAGTDTCAALSWCVNIGLSLTFAPLFAKTWRIYRIFGRRKLSVVAIGNRKLLMLVIAMLCAELTLHAVWQAEGGLQPLAKDVATTTPVITSVPELSSRTVINEFVQCGVPSGSSMTVFIVIVVTKALLFVGGALLAFSTRKVSSTFNESSGIALSIYNVCFTIGIIAPIIQVIDATGDVQTLLLAFALLWIACFTGGLLFGPKMLNVYHQRRDKRAGENNSVMATSAVQQSTSSSSGFVFLSLATFSSLPLISELLLGVAEAPGAGAEAHRRDEATSVCWLLLNLEFSPASSVPCCVGPSLCGRFWSLRFRASLSRRVVDHIDWEARLKLWRSKAAGRHLAVESRDDGASLSSNSPSARR